MNEQTNKVPKEDNNGCVKRGMTCLENLAIFILILINLAAIGYHETKRIQQGVEKSK
jgi:hypothetical protein